MSILAQFKTHVINFLDELIEQFPTEADLVIGRVFIKDQIPAENVMTAFIVEILPYKEEIKNRDDTLFLEGKMNFLQNVSQTKANHFKKIWKSSALDHNDRDVIWKWFDILIYFVEQYQKSKST